MEFTVKLILSGDPELMTTLATLVQCIQDVLHASNVQLTNTSAATVSVQPAPDVAPAPVAPVVPVIPVVPTAPAKEYTLAEFQAACAPLIDGGAKQQALMDLLSKYGVLSMTEIPRERYGELAQDLRALGAKL